jgi:hypothetical protein
VARHDEAKAMKLHPTALPTPEELARCMGMCDLRIGRHFLRDASGELTGSVSVCSLWHGEVVPSFQPRIALAVVTARGELSRHGPSTGFVKAVMATPETCHCTLLDADPLTGALNGLDLFCNDQAPPTHNGIAYALTLQTLHLHGTLQFDNPAHGCLRAMEESLLTLAEQIAAVSADARLLDVAAAWREFIRSKSA